MRKWLVAFLMLSALMLLGAAPAFAGTLAAPWDGNPISHGIGPTYGEAWPVPCPTSEAVSSLQGQAPGNSTLAVMPNADVGPLLAQFLSEGTAAGIPQRMTYKVSGQSAGRHDMYVAVVNDLETANQRRDYARWQHIREIELTNPAAAQVLLASYGADVKMPIYVEADINGNEYEGTDAMMQVLRDLTTTPLGTNAVVDNILNHAILIVVPTSNPDGRIMGIRGNAGVADTNRDYFLQSQPEEQIDAAIQQQWLATGALHLHGYETPMLVDGDTMPDNSGIAYDIFEPWNQKRHTQTLADFTAAGMGLQSPVNDWNSTGGMPAKYTIAAPATGATESGNLVTIATTASATQVTAGNPVTISGVAVSGYNGTFTVVTKVDTTHFTYTDSTPSLAASGGGTAVGPYGPAYAQGWDDWGPFYGQTYMAFLGVDSSTCEMDDSTADGGRLTAKKGQYLNFYSSANFWLNNRQAMMNDQLTMFLRGVENAPTDPNAIADNAYLTSLGFTDIAHNWMVSFPTAYVVPWGAGQRSDAEANRIVNWCFNNGIQVQRMTSDFTWNGQTFQAGSYVVSMSQALRGLAWNCFAAGTDIENRITTLYASPAAWSHGLLWGADTVEIPRGDATFAPTTTLVDATNSLVGGVRGSVDAPADFYSVTLKGVTEDKAVLALLRKGVNSLIAEGPFTSTTGGATPAGSLIFPADSKTAAALDAAGQAGGMWFERNVGVTMPATTAVPDSPKIAILASSVPASGADTDGCLTRIFGADAQYVATVSGAGSLENSATNPLNKFNVIYNAGASYSPTVNIAGSPAGATEAGNVVTITTTSSHNLAVGATITIAGVAVSGYNGTFAVTSVPSATTFTYADVNSGLASSGSTASATIAASPTGATESGTTVTITTSSAHPFSVGDNATIAGVGVTNYNGTYAVTAVPTSTTFTYTSTRTGLAASGGGTATRYDATATYTGAQNRLNAFFARGGGYIATNVSASNFTFLTGASLVTGSLTQGSQSAFGGIATWSNTGAANSAITGPYPSSDYMFLPANTTYFSATPTGAVVDAQYPSAIATVGPANGYVSGMWLNRDPAANGAPVLIHGTTTANSRYVAYATNPFSRYDDERDWPLIVQAALWSDLTDKGQIAFTVTATAGTHGTVSPSGAKMVAVGNDETYAITPDSGYHVSDVLVDGTTVGPVGSYTFTNVAVDHTISATFAADAVTTYTITSTAGLHGMVSPAQTVNSGSNATFTITPDKGYHVAKVLVDGVSVGALSSYTFTNVTGDHTISATFAFTLISTKLTINARYSSVRHGHYDYFSGIIAPNQPNGTGIGIYVKKPGSHTWVRVSTRHTFNSRRWSLSYRLASRGTYYFQVRFAATSKYKASTSRTIKVVSH